jgi:hypothetical protein
MKCQIEWIDSRGKPSPDHNDAVMIARFHESIWSHPNGHPNNRIIGYSETIRSEFPICQVHLDTVRPEIRFPAGAWSFRPIGEMDLRIDGIRKG